METDLLTIKEVAEWLRLTPQTIRNHVRQGKIPFKTIDGELRFSKQEVLNNMVRSEIDPKCIKQREEQEERTFRKMKILQLRGHFHNLIRYSLVKDISGRPWESIVGYNLEALKRRLKATIPDGYTWQDFINGRLHIDHIVPGCVFNIEDENSLDLKRSWELKNLRLIPARENIKKGSKILQPFQPGLNLKGVTYERDHRTIS